MKPTRRVLRVTAVLALVAIVTQISLADVLVLKSGRRLEGKVKEFEDMYSLTQADGSQSVIPKRLVKEFIKDSSPAPAPKPKPPKPKPRPLPTTRPSTQPKSKPAPATRPATEPLPTSAGKGPEKTSPVPEVAWARFLLHEAFIPASTRKRVNHMVSVGAAFAGMMRDGATVFIKPSQVNFRPVAISRVVDVIGKWQETGDDGGDKLYKWGDLVLKGKKGSKEVSSFGFTKKFLAELPEDADIFGRAKKLVSVGRDHRRQPKSRPAAAKGGQAEGAQTLPAKKEDRKGPETPAAKKAKLLSDLIAKGDALAKQKKLSAWWAYRIARAYSPTDEAISKKMDALGITATIDLSAEEVQRMRRVFGRIISHALKDWPRSTEASDVADLRVLLDPNVVSDFRCSQFSVPAGQAKVLVQAPSITLTKVVEACGKPQEDRSFSKYDVRFITYGRMRLVADLKGKVFVILFHEGE